MPNYATYRIGERKIDLRPSGFTRSKFDRIPFYNGTEIIFDLIVSFPYRKDVNDSFKIYYQLLNKKTNESVNNDFIVQYSNIPELLKQKPRNYDYIFFKSTQVMQFVFPKMINLGRYWNFDTYDLIFREQNAEKNEIVVEFTLKDIDEFGLQYANNLVSAGIGILGGVISGVIVGVITFFILRSII